MTKVTEMYRDGDQQVLDVCGGLPSGHELEFAAEHALPIDTGALPPGTLDLDFLAPIASRILDLRVFSATMERVEIIETMIRLRRLSVDDQLVLPAVKLRRLVALEEYSGSLGLAPDVLTLPRLVNAAAVVNPKQTLRVENDSLRELRIAHKPRTQTFAGIEGQPNLTMFGLSDVRDLSLAEIPFSADLEQLHLARIGTLRDTEMLRKFPKLRMVTLTDVRRVDADALGRLDCRVELLRTPSRAKRAAFNPPLNVTMLA